MKNKLYVINNSVITFDLDFVNYLNEFTTIPCKKYLFTAAPDEILFGVEYELSAKIIQVALNFYEGIIEVIKDGMVG